MAKKIVTDLQVEGKKVLVRVDFNVPLKDGVITDDNRIVQALPTIKYLIDHNAKVILFSHLGKVKSEEDKAKLSLRPVAERLSELLEKPVTFHNMIAPDKEVEVSLLFFIINNSSSSQTNILAQLMDFFTGNGHLEDLSKISEPEAIYAYIAEAIA